ncbi:sensor histidine kinase [Marinobacter sp. OP 3.4]|uniref:sensor histidine kinase n=1 Tax=Marinobacter sp. OP 3.4 TaxID=3076501 RepID=UPI002E22ECA1
MSHRLSAVLILLPVLVVFWVLGGWYGLHQLEQNSLQESFRYQQLIASELKRYLPLPGMVAEHPVLASALRHPDDDAVLLQANRQMQKMAEIVGGSDVYLMDLCGLTIAANNYAQPDSFVGNNYSFRPYFQEAISNDGPTAYFALGTQSRQRGLYFSHPVRGQRGRMLGVVAVKVLVNELESQWHRPDAQRKSEMVVLDGEGIAFLSSNPDWVYRDFEAGDGPLSAELRQRYPGRELRPIEWEKRDRPWVLAANSALVDIAGSGRATEYLSVRTELPRLDWSLQVMVGTRSVTLSRLGFALGGLALYLAGFLTWLYLRERYRRERELAIRGEQLERRVTQRTEDLQRSNDQLMEEIQQRERTRNELRETQQELIQAAKLAVLGQMSAGLNHEMNQPLTAIQGYARNSRKFLQRGATETVDANLSEIIGLCEKMAEMIRQFKVFARKSEGPPSTVDMRMAVDAALKIIRAQSSSEGVDIRWHRPDQPAMCHGDLNRIEQVMVNLLANAVQAVETQDQPRITIDLEAESDYWRCTVRDNGPGLSGDTEQVFEPFFTTKSMKQGLGLGLSISRQIVDALGGTLTGQNRVDTTGAEFVLKLKQRKTTE